MSASFSAEFNTSPAFAASFTNFIKGAGEGMDFRIDNHTLKFTGNVLSVNTTGEVEGDNTRPITSAGVYTVVGNINALLEQI